MALKIILASESQNRRELLKLAGLTFDVVPSRINEEEITHKKPEKLAEKLAITKAREVAKSHKKHLIIAGDTFGLYRNTLMQKPTFKMDALERLKSLSGTSHVIITGWCVLNSQSGEEHAGVSTTRVFFRELDEEMLLNYVNDVDVVRYAAGYSPLNTRAVHFIEKIEGSLTSFSHGLPLESIMPLIERWRD